MDRPIRMTGTASVICFSTADWDAPLWSNKQHLMGRLASSGVEVLYLDSLGLRAPGLGGTDLRRMLGRLGGWRPFCRSTAEGVHRDSPLVIPFHRFTAARAANRVLLDARLRRNERRLRLDRPVVWSYTPAAADVFSPSRHRALVYHCVDDLAAYPGIDADSFRAGETRLIRRADVCIGSSLPLVSHLEAAGAAEVLYWPNPADTGAFGNAAAGRRTPNERPVIGFVGAVSEHKVDFALLRTVAAQRPEWRIVLVGPIGMGLASSSVDAGAFPRNVEFWGLRTRDELPGIVAGFDVAVIPYLRNGYTNGVFPMKVFEYLGAGVPVVTTSLPSLVGEVEHLAFADDPDAFIAAIEASFADDPDAATARRAYAEGFSWDNRTRQALDLLTRL